MPDIKDVLTYLIPKSPLSLTREGKFPDPLEVLAKMTWQEQVARLLGHRYCWLCRLTGAAWAIWTWNFLGGLAILGVGAAYWIGVVQLTQNTKILLAVILAVLFLGTMLYSGVVLIALQLADSCIRDIAVQRTSEIKIPPEFRRPTDGPPPQS